MEISDSYIEDATVVQNMNKDDSFVGYQKCIFNISIKGYV